MPAQTSVAKSAQVLVVLVAIITAIGGLSACDGGSSSHSTSEEGQAQQRLAVFSPALAHTLRELGHADRIVARHGFDLALDPGVPIAGDQHGFDYEMLLARRPTTIVMETGASELPARLTELAEHRQWAIVRLPTLALDDVRDSIPALDRLATGADDDAPLSPQAADMLARWDAVLSSSGDAAAITLGPTVSMLHAHPIGLAGPASFSAQVIERLGGVSIPTRGQAYQSVSAEALIELNPKTIVLYLPGASAADVAEQHQRLVELGLQAARAGRVIVIDEPFGLLPSVALIDTAEAIVERAAAWGEPHP
ncbi:MAG: ABC transporter substrate-binding protein [Planctomycetota bacterium]